MKKLLLLALAGALTLTSFAGDKGKVKGKKNKKVAKTEKVCPPCPPCCTGSSCAKI